MEFRSIPLPTFPLSYDEEDWSRLFPIPTIITLQYELERRISGQDKTLDELDELDILGPMVASSYKGGGFFAFDKNLDVLGVFENLDIDNREEFLDFVRKYGVETTFSHLAGLSYRKTYDHNYSTDHYSTDPEGEDVFYDVDDGLARFLKLSFQLYLEDDDAEVEHLIPDSYGEDQYSALYNPRLDEESLEAIRTTVSPYFKRAQRDIKAAMKAKGEQDELFFLLVVNKYLLWHCRIELKPQLSLVEISSSGLPDVGEELHRFIIEKEGSPDIFEYMAPIIMPLDIIGAAVLAAIEQAIEAKDKVNFYCGYCKKYLPPEKRSRKYCDSKCALKAAQSDPIYRIKKTYWARAQRRGLDEGSEEWIGFQEELEGLRELIEGGRIDEKEAKERTEKFAKKYKLEKRSPGRPTKKKE